MDKETLINQHIFSLYAQIQYINQCLEKEKVLSRKIGDIFKERELSTIKNEITEKIETLVQESPSYVKSEASLLQKHWNHLKLNLEDERQITGLLQEAFRHLKTEIQKIYNKRFTAYEARENSLSLDPKKVGKSVQGFFRPIPGKHAAAAMEKAWPQTIHSVFTLAEAVDKEMYGSALKSKCHDSQSLNNRGFLVLLFGHSLKNNDPNFGFPEVFLSISTHMTQKEIASLQQIKNIEVGNVLAENREADWFKKLDKLLSEDILSQGIILRSIFDDFVSNLTNPTHVLVSQLVHLDLLNQAIEVSSHLQTPIERSAAYSQICKRYLESDTAKAAYLWKEIQLQPERSRIALKIIKKLIHNNNAQTAIDFAKSGTEAERDNLLKEVVVCLARANRAKEAEPILNQINDADSKAYAQSILVHSLATNKEYETAKELASRIRDKDLRIDAFEYIVKALVKNQSFEEASLFVNLIEAPDERKRPAEYLESTLKLQSQKTRIKKVNKIFSLIQPFSSPDLPPAA